MNFFLFSCCLFPRNPNPETRIQAACVRRALERSGIYTQDVLIRNLKDADGETAMGIWLYGLLGSVLGEV